MLSTWFAHPVLLWTLLAVPVCAVAALYALIRRRRLVATLAGPMRLRKSVLVRPRVRRWKSVCMFGGIALLALGAAGPQWGLDKDAQHRKGRDVIVVLDLSRSMLAEQPSRRELAIYALRDLADAFEEQGGNRVALIAFAARPLVLFPLTQDCDHLRHVIEQIEDDDIPKLTVDEPVSGTRIGAALELAAQSVDLARTNRPVIILLSDGDDPADDNEWVDGVAAVKAKQIRIHTVGIGHPGKAEKIPVGREFLSYDGKPVVTKLNEPLLKEIARRTDGVYLAAHNLRVPLGALIQHLLDADELRAEGPSGAELPVYQLRYAWFLFSAVVLFMLGMFLNEGPSISRNESTMTYVRKPRSRRAAVSALMVAAVACISAGDPPTVESLLRQGNDAFAQQDYERALKLYEQAEPLTLDPGQVSFNRAAAHYRLGQHKEAIECYRRSLGDDQAPAERRTRAHFDLGNALLHYAGDNAPTLAEAVAEYRACLHQPSLPERLRTDARHNLEIAQLLWLKARERSPDQRNPDDPEPKQYPDDVPDREKQYTEVKPGKGDKRQGADDLPEPSSKPKRMDSKGTSKPVPDTEQVVPRSPEDTLATLEAEARRIARERRLQRDPGGPAELSTKDW